MRACLGANGGVIEPGRDGVRIFNLAVVVLKHIRTGTVNDTHTPLGWVAKSGGMLAGCSNPARQQLRGSALPLRDGQVALNGWVKLDPNGEVSVVMARSEMGQGAHTALLMLVAEELDCAWDQLRMEEAPIDGLYGNVTALSEGVPFRLDLE